MISNSISKNENSQAAALTGRKPLGLYIHIPFCRKKCLYCDFVSFAGCEDRIPAYTDRLCEEIVRRGTEYGNLYYADSIFIGGGTPSLLPEFLLEKILDAVRAAFFCTDPEITVECNPGTVNEATFAAMKSMGVNRISLGVQSLSNPVLKKLGRIHNRETALQAMDMAAAAGLDCNVDLMFGVPGQTPGIWKKTLRTVLEKHPAHISFYSLQLEEDTPLCDAYRNGQVELPSWEENREMYHFAVDTLRAAGYHHYEISNASLPGKECRHNLKYWTMQDYLGLGAAAYSFLGQKRFYNTSDPEKYLYARDFGHYSEEPDATGLRGDWIFTALRLTEGFSFEEYRKYFGSDFRSDFSPIPAQLEEEGLLEMTDTHVRLTETGRDNTNPVMEKLLTVQETGSCGMD